MFRTECPVRVPQNYPTPATDWIPSPVRYTLNYKRLPYRTVWLELHELEPVAKKLGAKATKVKPNG